MVDCLVFSKDRAAQLDLLLRSIEQHAPKLYGSLTVLWEASAPEYERGYRRLVADRKRLKVTFWREYDFEKQVRHWLRIGQVATGVDLISFLCDDDVFYGPAIGPVCSGWSPRGGDYDYPFSIDGVVYARPYIWELLDGLSFKNPTELEAQGHDHRDRLPFDNLYPAPPALTGLPWNRVSPSSGMPSLGFHEYELNERFLAGQRLALIGKLKDAPPHTTNLAPVFV